MAKEEKKRAKLEEIGVDYDFPGYVCTTIHSVFFFSFIKLAQQSGNIR